MKNNDDIINLVGNLIVQCQREKRDRYNTCGCSRCRLQAENIEVWLGDMNLVHVIKPDDNTHDTVTIADNQGGLCHGCLRETLDSHHCPYCGTAII